jgi:hypothetical protein
MPLVKLIVGPVNYVRVNGFGFCISYNYGEPNVVIAFSFETGNANLIGCGGKFEERLLERVGEFENWSWLR